ncbi:Protein of unknown function [Desulfomicrobium apsheronum]|uniref:DUF1538 domain-containing protein n=1 Tax=Desulfomicrobium apsheronum TaxID=52560 RepID=A0A1I3Q2H2_9BACT|nr:DUF1538 domain-containing protein [Desulfomicrobium apsheronum]SFJ27822.1 Protein of unknown function [Desulfomicrobium apsheronum]
MNIILEFLNFRHVAMELFIAFAPLVLFFAYMQHRSLRLPRSYVLRLLKGVILSYVGLVLFLQGVTQGFLPAGTEIGRIIGGAPWRWALVPLGFFFGLAATAAEPAVRVLAIEMEKASGGSVGQKPVLVTLSLGVGIFVALAMFKLLAGISILWFVVPGYVLALVMTRFSTPSFISAAFDAGGVATGPMTVTFVMAIALGAAGALEGRDAVADGFGLIALVALAPILSVMALGILYSRKRSG